MKRFMKSLRVIISMVLVLAMLGGSSVFAAESGYYITDDQGVECYVDELGYLHSYYDVSGNPIPASIARFELDSELTMCGGLIPGMNNQPNYQVTDYDVYLLSQTQYYGSCIKVTPDCAGPCTINMGSSVTKNWAWSVEISATAKDVAKLLLDLNFGIKIENSVSSNTSFGVSFPVPEGKIGAVYFSPKLLDVTVIVDDDINNSSTTTTCTSGVKLINGFADGLYQLITY